MASRVITTIAGTGIKALGSVIKGAGSLVTKAGRSKPSSRRKRHEYGDGTDDHDTPTTRS